MRRRSLRIIAIFASLEHWYEALRLLVVRWEEDADASVVFLRMMRCHEETSCWHPDAARAIVSFFANNPPVSARLDNLCNILYEKIGHHGDFRGIIFTKQRVATHILKCVIERDARLQEIVRARCIYSTKSGATASLKVDKTRSEDIYYDPMDHAVSYVQGRGRARQANSSFVMLGERPDCPAALLSQQEAEQHSFASTFTPEEMVVDTEAEMHAQRQREKGAMQYLLRVTEDNSLANLNIFCKKTKVVIDEVLLGASCQMTYRSVLREISVAGEGRGKKLARKNAAAKLLRALHISITTNAP